MRKKTLNFTAVIYPDANSDWLVAHNPETGTTPQGKAFEEALANLKEATELCLSESPLREGQSDAYDVRGVVAGPRINFRMFPAGKRAARWNGWGLHSSGRAAVT